MPTPTLDPLLELTAIGKRFGPVRVLAEVSLHVGRGEVHALVGENGAGKSTLMHILAGVLPPDEGRIRFDGQENLRLAHPRQAQAAGIATVFQERSLFPHLSVAENIFAGRQPRGRFGAVDGRRLRAEATRLLRELRVAVDAATPVAELAPDQQQMVEVAKALSLDARLVIFDEPTAALTGAETRTLFAAIRLLRERGTSVIYISHRLEEIFTLADRVTVLKDGRVQATLPVAATTPRELVRLMVGRSVAAGDRAAAPARPAAPPVLEVRDLADAAAREARRTTLRGVSFAVHAGEIVGLAGLAGAGRTETALSVIGIRPRGTGEVRIDGRVVSITQPAAAIAAGIGYLPEDRKSAGIFAEMDLVENIAAAGLKSFGSWWLDAAAAARFAADCRARLNIACRDLAQPIAELSGGNQQKCLLARWLRVKPRILIVDEPTRGVDVGAKSEVHALLRQLAAAGTAVLAISSDLPEVLALSDRILVMREGRIAGELPGGASEEDVMRLASLETPAPAR